MKQEQHWHNIIYVMWLSVKKQLRYNHSTLNRKLLSRICLIGSAFVTWNLLVYFVLIFGFKNSINNIICYLAFDALRATMQISFSFSNVITLTILYPNEILLRWINLNNEMVQDEAND